MTACATCGRQPIGSYAPDPQRNYLCPYCNEAARLADAGVVVDSFGNVCHEDCLNRALGDADSQSVPE